MEALFATILGSPLTPVTLAMSLLALIIFSMVRGWLLPKSTVLLLITAEKLVAENYKLAWEAEKSRNDTLTDYLRQLLTYAETADKVLKSIPLPAGTIAVVPVSTPTEAPEGGTS